MGIVCHPEAPDLLEDGGLAPNLAEGLLAHVARRPRDGDAGVHLARRGDGAVPARAVAGEFLLGDFPLSF